MLDGSIQRVLESGEAFWNMLQLVLNWFSSEPNLPEKSAVPIKMWATMTLEQKMWIAGSYFHYSAVDGWENIEACDVIGNSGDKNVVFDALMPLVELSSSRHAR